MRSIITFLVFIVISIASVTTKADILVLVHGYLGSADSWELSGINQVLEANGWERGGLMSSSPASIAPLYLGPGKDAANKVYMDDLPSEAPIVVQTDHFLGMLATIQTMHPDENLIIVGHSAGGVVARMALVRGQRDNIKALITIASPHVGTTRANQAIEATDESGPFGFVKSFFGGDGYDLLRRSRGLLFDLAHPRTGSLLYWLNAQQHPDIKYISVVRLNPVGFAGDELVPGYSQDMNNVPPIQGNSSVIATPAGHTLVAQDGTTLLQILERLDQTASAESDPVS
jgi:pimeloyl-ACP methyl ester carboxylesterase